VELSELDQLEISGHSFDIITLEKRYDFWFCDMAVDGVHHMPFHERHEDIVNRGIRPYSQEFEVHMKAQAMMSPPCSRCVDG
jgi:hypothetical protein